MEHEPVQKGQLTACQHAGFWKPVDTLVDKRLLDELWAGKRAPWKLWNDRPAVTR